MPDTSPEPPLPRVLVVDDAVDARDSLRLLFEMWGLEVRDAANGEAALEVARAFRPDIAVLDIRLPGIDGFELARRLRQLPGLAAVDLVAITGHHVETDNAEAASAGFKRLLAKPYDPRDLESLVNNWRAARGNP
jgi:CheY-like chemotaxis protein